MRMANNVTMSFEKDTTTDFTGADAALTPHRVAVETAVNATNMLVAYPAPGYIVDNVSDLFQTNGASSVEMSSWSTTDDGANTDIDVYVWAVPYRDKDGDRGRSVLLLKTELAHSGLSVVGKYPVDGKDVDPDGTDVSSLTFYECDGYNSASTYIVTDQVKLYPDDNAQDAAAYQLRFMFDVQAYEYLHVAVTECDSQRIDIALRRVG
jgi:hypothetical protein